MRTMHKAGKKDNFKTQMGRMKASILRVNDVRRWVKDGKIIEDYAMLVISQT